MGNDRETIKDGFIHMRINKELKNKSAEIAKANYTDLTQMITDYLAKIVRENEI